MPRESFPSRAVRCLAIATTIAFAAGLAAGAVTIIREDRHFLAGRMPTGPDATADWFLQSTGMGTSDGFLNGIARAQLPGDAAVAYVAPVSGRSAPDYWQTSYIASYLLAPRAVRVIAWCDAPADIRASTDGCESFPAVTDLSATVTASGARYVLVAGSSDLPLDAVRVHHLSSRLTLLDLR